MCGYWRQAFLKQEGCGRGRHAWKSAADEQQSRTAGCRTDWMQTATHVVVNVYCKQYDPSDARTLVHASPVRLRVRIHFPAPQAPPFVHDIELRGVRETTLSFCFFFFYGFPC